MPSATNHLRPAGGESSQADFVNGLFGDVGAVCDAAGVGALHARFLLHREGVDDHAGLAHCMAGAGATRREWVTRFASSGPVGRAVGRSHDARRTPGYPPYDTMRFHVPVLAGDDVDARVRVRLAEVRESIGPLRRLLDALPPGGVDRNLPSGSGEGVGVAESFHGDAWHWVRVDRGTAVAAFAAAPSWRHWPLLEAAAAGGAVGNVTLVAESFDASCPGVDL